ncbi:MAG TPA: hypothetical protein VK507_16165, partial [Iamia sp.]|nr:hypothetical protein [Iamia sp.]
LVGLARKRPLVVVVEDLHWADAASLRLLEFVARHGWYERLLLVGTYRDVEVEAGDHALAPWIGALVAKATTVALTGLDRGQVGTLVEATTGRTPPPDVIDDLHRRTGGNPFFVEQTARLWLSRGAVDVVPPGVRDAVDHRLDLLPAATRDALVTTALLGHAVARPVLAAALDVDDGGVDAVLGEAIVAGLLVTTDDGYAFVHDLVRETLADGLDEADARRRHAALVARLDGTSLVSAGDLAHHAHHAGAEVDLDRRVALLQAAARHAVGRMAVDEALVHLRRALADIPEDRPRDRAFAQVELGWTLMRTGDMDACRRVFEAATRLAVALDDPGLLTRAALSLRAAVWLVASEEAEITATEMVDEAHRRLVVEGGLPTAATTSWEREQELSALALEMCRSSGDDQALWDALNARHDALWTPGSVEDRLALTAEMVTVARRNAAAGQEVEGLWFHILDLLEAGDPRAADENAAFQALARQLDSAWSRSLARWVAAIVGLLEGRFDDARAHLDETMAVEARAGLLTDDVTSLHLQVRWAVELQQGRDDAVDALLDRIAAVHPHPELLRALTAVDRGDVERAARTVSELRDTDAEPGRWFAPLWIRLQAEVAGATADVDLAAALAADLRPALAPLAGQWALMAQGAVDGPFDLWAGVVEAGQGDHDAAVARFAAAAASADALGAPAWAVEARARLLASRQARGDDPATLAPDLAAVAAEARALGLARVVERLARLAPAAAEPPAVAPAPHAVAPDVPRPPAPAAASAPAEPEAVFRRSGDVWELAFAGSSVHVPDAKGVRDIHVLLGRPGMGVRAVDLLDPEAGAAGRAARSMGGDDVLDERAKTAYRNRLTQLDEEIDAAL